MENKSRHHDIEGKESSKRHWAEKLLKNGIAMAWIAFLVESFVVLFNVIKCNEYHEIPTQLVWALFGTGATALGLTLGERIKRKQD